MFGTTYFDISIVVTAFDTQSADIARIKASKSFVMDFHTLEYVFSIFVIKFLRNKYIKFIGIFLATGSL